MNETVTHLNGFLEVGKRAVFVALLLTCWITPQAARGQIQFWDGPNTVFDASLHGGTGSWDNSTTNFQNTDQTQNEAWQGGEADFAAEPGTVTLGADILFHGMHFESDAYTIAGAGTFTLTPVNTAIVNTDPGVGATISATITGNGGLETDGLGVLTLTGVNSYSGSTNIGVDVSTGMVQAGSPTAL